MSKVLEHVKNARGTHINYKFGVIFVQKNIFCRMNKVGTLFWHSDFDQFWKKYFFLKQTSHFCHAMVLRILKHITSNVSKNKAVQ